MNSGKKCMQINSYQNAASSNKKKKKKIPFECIYSQAAALVPVPSPGCRNTRDNQQKL